MKVMICKHPAGLLCCQDHPEGAGVASRYQEFPLNLENQMKKRGGTLPGT